MALREAAASRLSPERRAVVDAHLVEILEELFNKGKTLRSSAQGFGEGREYATTTIISE